MNDGILPPAPRADNFSLEAAYQASYAYSWQEAQRLMDVEITNWLSRWNNHQFSEHPLVVVEAFGVIDALQDVLLDRFPPLDWFNRFLSIENKNNLP